MRKANMMKQHLSKLMVSLVLALLLSFSVQASLGSFVDDSVSSIAGKSGQLFGSGQGSTGIPLYDNNAAFFDFAIFFFIFFIVAFIALKQFEKSGNAGVALAVVLGVALALAAIKAGLSVTFFIPFVKNFMFFILFVIMYLLLTLPSFLGPNHKIWAAILAFILTTLLFFLFGGIGGIASGQGFGSGLMNTLNDYASGSGGSGGSGTPGATTLGGTPRCYGVVRFDFDSSVLRADELANINRFVSCVQGGRVAQVYLYGYASEEGTDSYNLGLSQQRAGAVATEVQRLLSIRGFSTSIHEEGKGKTTTFGMTPENRRVVMTTVAEGAAVIPPDGATDGGTAGGSGGWGWKQWGASSVIGLLALLLLISTTRTVLRRRRAAQELFQIDEDIRQLIAQILAIAPGHAANPANVATIQNSLTSLYRILGDAALRTNVVTMRTNLQRIEADLRTAGSIP
ncbi:OmpA family protein [Candidatus Woesearchaeota archaeon]|nr:OmpA family protein [Candidatus Woesearchaeota archaeon]